MQNVIRIISAFNRHGHLRGYHDLMQFVLRYTVYQYWGMVAMPNLPDPIVIWQQAKKYWDEIRSVCKEQNLPEFFPVMTAYLTDNTDPKNIKEGFLNGAWKAAKLYPFGATSNSDKGVTKLEKIFRVLEIMEEIGMPILIHPETDISRSEIMFEDRERVYTQESLVEIHKRFPVLSMSVEHVTTKEAVQFVENCPDNVVATVTPQHLLYNHNALFNGGVPPYKPGMYPENMCLPILKWPDDVSYLRNAIMHGKKKYKFGAGDDTAPWDQYQKHDHCSRCGVFNAVTSVELYAMAFDDMNMFDNEAGIKTFENFMSVNNLGIYGLEPSREFMELRREEQTIPELIPGNLRPFKAGQKIPWKMARRT